MKNLKFILGISLAFSLLSCAGDKADLEEARYLLGKGDIESANKAVAILEPQLALLSGSEKVEAYRLWAGGRMQSAGADSVRIIATVVYKVSNDTVALMRAAFSTLETDAGTRIRSARDGLTTFTSDASFIAASEREKQGIYFQIGLANLFEAMRVAVQVSHINDSNFDATVCQAYFSAASGLNTFDHISTNLGDALTNFNISHAGLDDTNALVSLTQSMQTSVDATPSALGLCTYLNQQKNLSL